MEVALTQSDHAQIPGGLFSDMKVLICLLKWFHSSGAWGVIRLDTICSNEDSELHVSNRFSFLLTFYFGKT